MYISINLYVQKYMQEFFYSNLFPMKMTVQPFWLLSTVIYQYKNNTLENVKRKKKKKRKKKEKKKEKKKKKG